jgi:hypothetical protein
VYFFVAGARPSRQCSACSEVAGWQGDAQLAHAPRIAILHVASCSIKAAIFVQLDNVIFRVYMCVCLKRFVHGKHSFQRVALIEGVRGRHRSSGPAPVARSRSPRHSAGPGRVECMSVNDVEIAPRAFHIIFHDNVSRRVFPEVP